MNELLATAITASIKAGEEILNIYNTDFKVEYKSDESPLTMADKLAHIVIMSFLEPTQIPILSEEGRSIPYSERKEWSKLWIVDPLDGTKEFVKKNDEFTVNIALIENQKPIMGVVYAPVLDELYFGDHKIGAYKMENASSIIYNVDDIISISKKIPSTINKDYFGVVASRSHLSVETSQYINQLKESHDNTKIVSKGSSLKICMIADGSADIYPRFAPTMEWDTAAGHAVVICAGKRIVQANSPTNEVVYNKEDLLNPWFIAK